MSGGRFDYCGFRIQDGMSSIAGDEEVIRRFSFLSTLLNKLGQIMYDMEHDIDWDLSGDHPIVNDLEFQDKILKQIKALTEKEKLDQGAPLDYQTEGFIPRKGNVREDFNVDEASKSFNNLISSEGFERMMKGAYKKDMILIGKDQYGITETSVEKLSVLHYKGEKLKEVKITVNTLIGTTCHFIFEGDKYYEATGFSIGYGGEGPRGLWKTIRIFYPDKLDKDFYKTEISRLDQERNWKWTPEGGFV